MQSDKFCVNCTHHRCDPPYDRESLWDHLCSHPDFERPIGFNPVTGVRGYMAQNDLGMTYYTDEKLPSCSRINTHGDCSRWESPL